MPFSESGSSIATDTPSISSSCLFVGDLHIAGYHFKTTSATYEDNVALIHGYKIATKQSVIAKVSSQSFRLEREFYVMKRLYQYADGPSHVVRPVEYTQLQNGLTAAIYLDDNTSSKSFPSPHDLGAFLRFAIQCTDCLDYIHRHQIVHGQVRLASLRFSDNRVKMWNVVGSSSNKDILLTSEGWRKTVNKDDLLVYMSPEQTGRTTYCPDHRSDIYSLGIVFYVLLTGGRHPFEGRGALDILNGILSRKITLVHELHLNIPEVVGRIVEKMTQKAPDDRYSSAHGVRADLKECLKRLEAADEDGITSFPLAQHDIASVFTLPKTIYGREPIISEMAYIIERCAGLYKPPPRSLYSSNSSKIPTETDSLSDVASSDRDSSNGHRSAIHTPSHVSGWDGNSDIASTSNGNTRRINRVGATIASVYGPGGIGKSTLFTAVQPTARQHGYVASAKFDSRNKVPYGAVIKALSQILQQILSECEEEMKRFYDHLKTSLGAQFFNVELLADFVPELKPLLENNSNRVNQREEIQMDNNEARIRFHNLYVEVFRSITQWRMTTLFLDDLHQADDPSLEILLTLVTSRVNILIFVSYRDQEMTTKLSQLLENPFANVHMIKVGPLDMNTIIDFVLDTLHQPRNNVDRSRIIPLAQVVFDRTHGNAFYAAQLLRTLERKRLIFFNWEKNAWDYNLQEIQEADLFESDMRELDVTFIVARLRELPANAQQVLKFASFVGDTFSWTTVKNLMMSSTDDECAKDKMQRPSLHRSGTSVSSVGSDPISGLQTVLQEGYIMPVGGDEFKWSHDRISQAAAELADPSTRDTIHLNIAQWLMNEREIDLFLVADHLLKSSHLLLSLDDKRPYRHVLIEAGNKGNSSGAHDMAFSYYMAAIELGQTLPDEWDRTNGGYNVSLNLHVNAVALSWAVGKYEHTERLLDIIFKHVKDPLDRLPAYRVQARYYYGCQLHQKGRMTLFSCLEELGENTQLDFTDEWLEEQYNNVQDTVERLGKEGVLDIPLSKDPMLVSKMYIMEELLTTSYWSGHKREMYYWAIRIISMSLTFGPTNGSCNAWMFAGLCYSNILKKFAFSDKLGTIGIALADKYGSNGDKGRAYSLYPAFLILWGHHHRDAIQWYRDGMKFSFSAGDRIYTSFHQIHIAILMFCLGYHIADTLRYAEACFEDIHAWSQSIDMNSFAMVIVRVCKALNGHTYTDTPQVLDGDDGFNDEHFLAESCRQSTNPELVMNWYESFKIIPLVLYGHLDTAIEMGYRCLATIEVHPNHRHTRMMLFYFSLALMEKVREAPTPEEKQPLLNQIKENQELIHEWATHSRINYGMYWTTIEAELTAEHDISKACRLYEKAIDEAREGSWLMELCVIHEYAGAFYQRTGMYNTAVMYVKKAIDLYMSHGSYGKARHVSTKFSDLLAERLDERRELHDTGVQTEPLPFFSTAAAQSWSTSSDENSNGNNSIAANEPLVAESIPHLTTEKTLMTLDVIDIASILKSSQVMSSEVKFQNLMTSMMKIILENSGADCGAIVVRDDQDGIRAYGSQEDPEVAYYEPPKKLSGKRELISSRIVHHTLHSKQSIFIPDVEKDPRFAVGPWYERTGSKSVICMPINHTNRTVGCLFVEGPVGIFTQRHITVLSLLCQQMGISITNASLFTSAQKATMAKIRLIEMQKRALEEVKRSKEEADRATRLREIFLANMSHEIRTPFSGFYGMISLLADTKLDNEQMDLVLTAKSSCEVLLQIIDDLLNFSKLQARKVSLDLAPVVVEDLVADVIEMLIVMALQKQINVTYTIEKDVPPVVMADSNRLKQIVINLLGNAIKFTHEGEIWIRCSIDKERQAKCGSNDAALLFEVIDTGIGISNEQRKVLFVPFSQVDGSTTRKYGGTGLGLSICLQLVELMSGTIDVTSTPGAGSNFHFTITTTRVPQQEAQHAQVIASQLMAWRGKRLLVASKFKSTVTMVQHLLPEVNVDGVWDVEKLPTIQANDYPVVIVGHFLKPCKQLDDLLARANNVIMLHYPSSSNNNNNGMMRHGIGPNPTIGEIEAERRQEKTSSTVVRMAVPIRRHKLLRAMCSLVQQQQQQEQVHTPLPTPQAAKQPSTTVTDEEKARFSKMHVLAAEDNPVAQKVLYKQLTRLGFQVQCANNGLEAIDAWVNHPPGYFKLGFFDHHMPKCDGVEATRRIRRMETEQGVEKRFPIVALTADIQESARNISLEVGMNGYLTKPFNTKNLLETLRRFCIEEDSL